jgi:hypothetical protein
MLQSDRREFQRLKLSKPILATVGTTNALILDVGMAGAFLEHYGVVQSGEHLTLTFRWQSQTVEFVCEVARTEVVRDPGGDGKSIVSHTGVRFIEAIGESATFLQELITSFVSRILEAQKANASGGPGDSMGATILARLGEARRMRTRGYIKYQFNDGIWSSTNTDSPTQPSDGFTIASYEDDDEIEKLCRTYEQSDEEGRRLIRLVAELSVSRA